MEIPAVRNACLVGLVFFNVTNYPCDDVFFHDTIRLR